MLPYKFFEIKFIVTLTYFSVYYYFFKKLLRVYTAYMIQELPVYRNKFFFFLREFQFMTPVFDNSFLSLDQDTN